MVGGAMKELRTIDDLAPAPYNPRRIKDEAAAGLGKSLDRFGDISGIVWNARTGHLVAGHQRVAQLRKLGATFEEGDPGSGPMLQSIRNGRLQFYPIRIVDWDEATERAANVAANNQHIAGEWTPDLDDVLRGIKHDIGEDAFAELRFDALDIPMPDALPPGEIPEDEVPEPPKVAVTQPGDVWVMGGHRLLCGDSGDAASPQRLMDGKMAYLLATDPPYGVDFSSQRYNPRAKEWDGIANDTKQGGHLTEWLGAILTLWMPHIDRQSAFYLWSAAMQEGAAAAAAAAGIHIQSQVVWVKNSLVLGQADYQWRHEVCWYGFLKGEKHRWYGGRDKTTVWEVSRIASAHYQHPMQKPVELYAKPMEHHTKQGDVVLDLFAGSGTSIIAAEQLNRRCFAIELEPKYCDVAVERWQNLTGQKARRERA